MSCVVVKLEAFGLAPRPEWCRQGLQSQEMAHQHCDIVRKRMHPLRVAHRGPQNFERRPLEVSVNRIGLSGQPCDTPTMARNPGRVVSPPRNWTATRSNVAEQERATVHRGERGLDVERHHRRVVRRREWVVAMLECELTGGTVELHCVVRSAAARKEASLVLWDHQRCRRREWAGQKCNHRLDVNVIYAGGGGAVRPAGGTAPSASSSSCPLGMQTEVVAFIVRAGRPPVTRWMMGSRIYTPAPAADKKQ